MSVFMTPVNAQFNPLPTAVFYEWKPDSQYSVATDRAQATTMFYMVNPGSSKEAEQALLFGPAPQHTTPPPGSDTSYLVSFYKNGNVSCVGPAQGFDFPQEPPNWISIPAVQGTIQCTITNNPVLCPNVTVTVYSVLFPLSLPNYPDSTYLWTWYAPLNRDGTNSRPITFMQSQSGVNKGTSLALADYFYFREFSFPVPPSFFAVPPACAAVAAKKERTG
jgi:hypothetical protein